MLGRRRKDKQQRELAELDAFRHVRRAADEDVTRFGEELAGLHLDTLGADLDEAVRADYQRALDSYEEAKAALARSATAPDVTGVTRVLSDGRWSHACVLAAQAGEPCPERRDPCFFDPAHGPATRDVEWAPVGGVPRAVPVCFRDAERLARGDQPEVRLVRLGDRRVAWFASGPLYAAWAGGWYAELVREGRIDAERLTMTYAGTLPGQGGVQLPLAAGWSDPGAWSDGGMIGGHDYSGWGDGGGGFGDGGGAGDGGGGGGDGG
ncbi:hypothetical protein SAMN05192575_10872 [Nocardioides alpinus]|uniref:Uncharacterized protein n=1 Tax=Nocardioides alpinus TaxID=748909 RepID=A0A1I1AAC6_9ACTN|nr:hypothetical protein [Nocardioides alpinus]PKH43447.1 hypothetical protein CXG46_03010 [Nocardioides alpinus]SFB34897.1 hypothetical protein SAMN05192575_10872 [Nocardioides alpinus]